MTPTTHRIDFQGPAWLVGVAVLIAGCGSPPVYTRMPGLGSDSGRYEDSSPIDAESDRQPSEMGVVTGTGGKPGTGGTGTGGTSTGGATATGGVSATGGAGSGGMAATGGAGSAGPVGTGGAITGSGGAIGGVGSGGAPATGGASGAGGAAESGGAPGTGGAVATGGTGSGGATTDSARYNFESSTQSWASTGTTVFTSIAQSKTAHFAGTGSLACSITETASNLYYVSTTPTAAIPAGTTITFHVFFPTGSSLSWIQPFAQEGSPNYTWTGSAILTSTLNAGQWNTMTIKTPANSGTITRLGVQVNVTAAWTGTFFVDSVNW